MMSPSTELHREMAAQQGMVLIAVITVSDSRTLGTDTNGHYLSEQIERAGHRVASYRIIKDEPAQVKQALDDALEAKARLILFNGGTGISGRDTTFDTLAHLLEKTLPGFGELFRMLSYAQVGSAAMLSRATAGTYSGRVVIFTPGSPAAVQLAWEKLIAPEIQHLAGELVCTSCGGTLRLEENDLVSFVESIRAKTGFRVALPCDWRGYCAVCAQ